MTAEMTRAEHIPITEPRTGANWSDMGSDGADGEAEGAAAFGATINNKTKLS